MSIRVFIDGRIRAPGDAQVSIFDRGFLYGDSVFETIATVKGRLFALPEHLDRLARSARGIGLRLPARAAIEVAIDQTVAAAGNPDSRVRVMVTRGAGPVEGTVDPDPGSADAPTLVVIVSPLASPARQMREQGVGVEIIAASRATAGAVDPSIKSGNYLSSILALGEARRRSGAHEAILCAPDGGIAEGSSSNVFAVVGGELRTPALGVGILEGVTRGKVLALASAAGVRCAEVAFMSPGELLGADEVFITSATRGVLPVTRIGGAPVGPGVPGPATKRLMALYDELAARIGGPT